MPVAHADTMPTLRAGASNGGAGHGARSGDSKDEYIVPMAFGWQNSSAQGDGVSELYAPTLDKSKTPAVAFSITPSNSNKDYNARQVDKAQALTAGGNLIAGMQVRRLTPRECARLQGFPDDYLDITYRGKPAADGPRYKALGNSWAIPPVRWIGRRLAEVDALARSLAEPVVGHSRSATKA